MKRVLIICLALMGAATIPAGAGAAKHQTVTAKKSSGWLSATTCRHTLRGYWSDDDIHLFGRRQGATGFLGWTSYVKHRADGRVLVHGRFRYPAGRVVVYTGSCDADYHGYYDDGFWPRWP